MATNSDQPGSSRYNAFETLIDKARDKLDAYIENKQNSPAKREIAKKVKDELKAYSVDLDTPLNDRINAMEKFLQKCVQEDLDLHDNNQTLQPFLLGPLKALLPIMKKNSDQIKLGQREFRTKISAISKKIDEIIYMADYNKTSKEYAAAKEIQTMLNTTIQPLQFPIEHKIDTLNKKIEDLKKNKIQDKNNLLQRVLTESIQIINSSDPKVIYTAPSKPVESKKEAVATVPQPSKIQPKPSIALAQPIKTTPRTKPELDLQKQCDDLIKTVRVAKGVSKNPEDKKHYDAMIASLVEAKQRKNNLVPALNSLKHHVNSLSAGANEPVKETLKKEVNIFIITQQPKAPEPKKNVAAAKVVQSKPPIPPRPIKPMQVKPPIPPKPIRVSQATPMPTATSFSAIADKFKNPELKVAGDTQKPLTASFTQKEKASHQLPETPKKIIYTEEQLKKPLPRKPHG